MKKVVCNFSLFDMNQTVYICNPSEDGTEYYEAVGQCSLGNLGKVIAEVCFANNIENVHLYGHEKYVNGILYDIDLCSGCSAYSNGMIKVEVN